MGLNDRIIGVLYGNHADLSRMYNQLENDGFIVLCGDEFWYHLTGYKNLYKDLVDVARKAGANSNMKNDIDNLILRVQRYIEENPKIYGL